MKHCSRCKILKPESEFYIKDSHTRKLQAACKDCHKATVLIHNRTYTKNQRHKIHEYLWEYKASHPCIDCGIDDPLVLQFDHRKGETKASDVSRLKRSAAGIKAVIAEVEKCDVRCANCHQRRTTLAARGVLDNLSSPS